MRLIKTLTVLLHGSVISPVTITSVGRLIDNTVPVIVPICRTGRHSSASVWLTEISVQTAVGVKWTSVIVAAIEPVARAGTVKTAAAVIKAIVVVCISGCHTATSIGHTPKTWIIVGYNTRSVAIDICIAVVIIYNGNVGRLAIY